MQKLIIKDKKLRLNFKKEEKYYFILRLIFQNSNLFMLIRWNAYLFLKAIGEISSKVSTLSRCLYTMGDMKVCTSNLVANLIPIWI